jgi:hypothetical protein
MSPTHVTPEGFDGAASGLAMRPRVIAAANADEVMREQLEYLIEHAAKGACGCSQCRRYQQARTLLLEAFTETPHLR